MIRSQTRDQQIKNILVAIDLVKSLNPHKFTRGLGSWSKDVDFENPQPLECGGGKMCFGGWLTVHPYFRRKGVRAYGEDSGAIFSFEPRWKDEPSYDDPEDISQVLFGRPDMFHSIAGESDKSERRILLDKLKDALDDALRV